MFIIIENSVLDPDLDLLIEFLSVVDRQLEIIETEASRSSDPDACGHFDRIEGIVGIGFVACQQYLNATYRQLAASTRREAIERGPKHACGRSFAELVDAAANYWKHHDEWPGVKDGGREAKTRAAIDSLTPSSADYPLGNVIAELVRPKRPCFAPLVGQLEQWRDMQSGTTGRGRLRRADA